MAPKSTKRDPTPQQGGTKPRPAHAGGRPAFKPTPAQRDIVKAASGFGMKQSRICQLVLNPAGDPIDKKTLELHFRAELDVGIAQTHFNVGKTLYTSAVGIPKLDASGKQIGWLVEPNITAAIWFSKAQMKWTDRTSLDPNDLKAVIAAFGGNIAALRAARAAGNSE